MNRPFVEKIAKRLGAEPRTLLDIGCGEGEIAMHLARLGHRVIGITNNADELKLAQNKAERNTTRGICEFRLLDASEVYKNLHTQAFDAVVAINVLHELPRIAQLDVIDQAKKLTRAGGLHAVSGYVVDPASIEHQSRKHALRPGELMQYYAHDSDWAVVDYNEDEPFIYESAGIEWVNSHADLIARKIPRPHLPTDNF